MNIIKAKRHQLVKIPLWPPDLTAINVAQVVFPGTFHGQEVSIAGAAGLGHGNALAAVLVSCKAAKQVT